MQQRISSITFGLAGIIAPVSADIGELLEIPDLAFRILPVTTKITWHGTNSKVLAYQHCEDTRLEPGSYTLEIPSQEGIEGVLYGQFFELNKNVVDHISLSVPVQLSHRMVTEYARRGVHALSDINGAFISFIWDRDRQRAVFARDRVGVTPLYVTVYSNCIIFTTDLRILGAMGLPLKLDEQSIAEFLHYLYVPNPRTIYTGIHAVLPGHTLLVDGHTFISDSFTVPRFIQGVELKDRTQIDAAIADYLPQFEEHLLTAVTDCLPKEGRVGLLISGGKDSSALAIALSQVIDSSRISAFTIGSHQSEVDEAGDAANVCRFLRIPHQSYVPQLDEIVLGVKQFVNCMDQPFADPASLPLFIGLQHLPHDVSVVWDGTGNDYYFGIVKQAGWKNYHLRYHVQQVIPRPLWSTFVSLLRLGPPKIRSIVPFWSPPIEESFVSWNGWSLDRLTALYRRPISLVETYLWQMMRRNAKHNWRTLQTEVICGIWEPHAPYRKATHLILESGRTPRFPFIDNRLAYFVNSLPRELKFQGYTNKILLRAYLAKYLPEELLQKPKGSFVFDVNVVLQYQEQSWPNSLYKNGLLKILPNWSDETISRLFTDYQKFVNNSGLEDSLYALCLLATWFSVTRQ